jgi:hypothetical protein
MVLMACSRCLLPEQHAWAPSQYGRMHRQNCLADGSMQTRSCRTRCSPRPRYARDRDELHALSVREQVGPGGQWQHGGGLHFMPRYRDVKVPDSATAGLTSHLPRLPRDGGDVACETTDGTWRPRVLLSRRDFVAYSDAYSYHASDLTSSMRHLIPLARKQPRTHLSHG